MTNEKRRRWPEVQPVHGLPGDQIASALQKEIWRGRAGKATLIAHEMALLDEELKTSNKPYSMDALAESNAMIREARNILSRGPLPMERCR